MKARILLVENIHPVAVDRLKEEGHTVTWMKNSPGPDELNRLLQQHDVLGIRSKTELTATLLKNNPHLIAIGAFCIGVNQIDLATATTLGIPVFNAPHSNTRSVAELILSEIVALSRKLCDRSQATHRGDWAKAAVGNHEVRGKTIGIVGYGHIGSQVSILAEAFGMRVIFFDTIRKLPLGNASSRSRLQDLLNEADFVTLHVPETDETRNMMGAKQISQMKKGSYLLNASRGTVVDLEALAKALSSGQLAGAAVDVFPIEPASNDEKFQSPLQGLENVILTPHIGGSTEEAQYAIGQEVSESFNRWLSSGSTISAVQFPKIDLPRKPQTRRILNIHRNEPGVLSEINGVVSKFGANIVAQSLSTFADIGYVIMDFESAHSQDVAKELGLLKRSLKTRELNT